MKNCRSTRSMRGITLIELMIVIAILGLLSAIAIPSYSQYVRKAHRTDAMRELMDLGAMQERFYAQNSTYTSNINTAAGLNLGRTTSADGHYNLTSAAGTTGSIATSYALSATPIGSQADDTDCNVLSVNSLGQRTGSGTLGNDCW